MPEPYHPELTNALSVQITYLRNKVIAEVRKSKQLQVDKLADKLKTDDIGQRD